MKQHFAIIVMCLAALIVTVPTVLASEDCYTKNEVDSILKNYRPSIVFAAEQFPDSLTFCGITVDLTDRDYRERFERELLLIAEDQAQLLLYLLRAERYFPIIDPILDSHGVFLDYRYVCVVESGLRAKVGSHAGAKGWWQFMKRTGRTYLVINDNIDQRYDLIASTHAAARYLVSLGKHFEDPFTTMAAYNWGRYNVSDAINDQGTADYFMLEMPNETMRYVVRGAAIKWAMEHPEQMGIRPERINFWDGLYPADTATVTIRHGLSAQSVVDWCGVTRAEIENLNPELTGDGWTPVSSKKPATYKIKLSHGTLAAFQAGLDKLTGKKKK